MSVPTREEAAAIVRGLQPNEKLLRHSSAVAEVAAFLAAAMVRRGIEFNSALVESAALLHDMDKMLPEDDGIKPLGHGAAGPEWPSQCGDADLAPAVASHPVMEIGLAASYDELA